MRIGTNIGSLTALRSLQITTKAIARSMARLASGRRINTAADDAAGLAISTSLESEVRGLAQIQRNLTDGGSLLAVADGAVRNQLDLLARMRELSLQAANGTLADRDRSALNDEFQVLLEELDRIATQTQFQGQGLINGDLSEIELQAGTQQGDTIAVGLNSTRTDGLFLDTVSDGFTEDANNSITIAAFSFVGVAGDLNNDGHLDLLRASLGTSATSMYLGNGDGTFTSGSAGPSLGSSGLRDGGLIDFNGDGNLDVYMMNQDPGIISINLGNGNGTFKSVVTYSQGVDAGLMSSYIEAADMNGDGIVDLVTGELSQGQVSLYIGNGNGTFQARTTYAATVGSIKVGDVNGDGRLDIIGKNGTTLSVLINNGSGFNAAVTSVVGATHSTLDVGDMNGDGLADVVSGSTWVSNIYTSNGDGTFALSATRTTTTNTGGEIALYDLDGDGNLDIVGGNSIGVDGAIIYGDGEGGFRELASFNQVQDSQFFNFGDFNEDGFNDFVVTNSDYLKVYIQKTEIESMLPEMRIGSQIEAQNVIEWLDSARQTLLELITSIGASQNRLEFAASSSLIQSESMQSALSQIRDVDYAEETADFVRLQILQQAGVGVLAQANLNHRLVLELLNFR